jgi:hypothetical protein
MLLPVHDSDQADQEPCGESETMLYKYVLVVCVCVCVCVCKFGFQEGDDETQPTYTQREKLLKI